MNRNGLRFSLVWSGIENLCRQALSLVFFFISVRFLHPYQVGVFAFALALTSVGQIVVDEVVGEALIQKKEITIADWNTGYTVNLMLALGVLLIALLASYPLAALVNVPSLTVLLPMMGVSVVIGALGNMHKAFFARNLRFRLLALITLTGQGIGGITSVVLAASGFGYWALASGIVVTTSVSTILYRWNSDWKPVLGIDRAMIASRLPYCGYVTANRTIYMVRDQAPVIIVGMFIGPTQAGLLNLALRVVRCLGQMFEDITTRPLIALISREQHNLAEFVKLLMRVMMVIGFLALPAYSGLAIVGPEFVTLFFGANWTPVGAFLPALCLVLGNWLVLHIAIVGLRAATFASLGTKIAATVTVLDVIILLALIPFGLKWMLYGWAARSLLSLPLAMYMLQTRLGLSAYCFLVHWVPALMATIVMVGGLELWDGVYGLPAGTPGLIGVVIASAVIYVAVLVVVTRGHTMEVINGRT
jgi:O-antigen/teichoic acid export membrane protein